jgi:hypothetical protein
VVAFTPRPLYFRRKSPQYPLDRRLGGPQSGLDDVEKRKFLTLPGLELRHLGHLARTQSLYRLRYPGSPINWLTYEIGNQISPWNKSHFSKLTVANPVNRNPKIYEIRRFITVFINVRYWFLSYARCIESLSHHFCLRSFLILSSKLMHRYSKCIFSLTSPKNILYIFLGSHMSVTCVSDFNISILSVAPRRKIEIVILQSLIFQSTFFVLRNKIRLMMCLGVRVSMCLYLYVYPLNNFWMTEPIFMNLGMYIIAPEPSSTAKFVNSSHQ